MSKESEQIRDLQRQRTVLTSQLNASELENKALHADVERLRREIAHLEAENRRLASRSIPGWSLEP